MVPDFVRTTRETSTAELCQRLNGSAVPAALVVNGDGVAEAIVDADAIRTSGGTVSAHARPVRATVPVGADLRQAVSLMLAHDMPVLPCVDDAGKVCGVMTFRSIVDNLGGDEP